MAGVSVGGTFLVVRQSPPSRTRMRTPVVKRQTPPKSGFLTFFRWVGPGAVGIQSRVLA
jgi:hypothetical protein